MDFSELERARERIAALIGAQDAACEPLCEAINQNEAALAQADAAMKRAELTGDADAYSAAAARKHVCEAAIERDKKRLIELKSAPAVEMAELNETRLKILAEQLSADAEALSRLQNLMDEFYQVVAESQANHAAAVDMGTTWDMAARYKRYPSPFRWDNSTAFLRGVKKLLLDAVKRLNLEKLHY